MDSSNLKTEVEGIIKEELVPLAVKTEASQPGTPAVSLAIVRGKELGPVKSGVTPFVIGVVTDDMEEATEKTRGFQLKFRQQPCS